MVFYKTFSIYDSECYFFYAVLTILLYNALNRYNHYNNICYQLQGAGKLGYNYVTHLLCEDLYGTT